jgi:hypothetical protein
VVFGVTLMGIVPWGSVGLYKLVATSSDLSLFVHIWCSGMELTPECWATKDARCRGPFSLGRAGFAFVEVGFTRIGTVVVFCLLAVGSVPGFVAMMVAEFESMGSVDGVGGGSFDDTEDPVLFWLNELDVLTDRLSPPISPASSVTIGVVFWPTSSDLPEDTDPISKLVRLDLWILANVTDFLPELEEFVEMELALLPRRGGIGGGFSSAAIGDATFSTPSYHVLPYELGAGFISRFRTPGNSIACFIESRSGYRGDDIGLKAESGESLNSNDGGFWGDVDPNSKAGFEGRIRGDLGGRFSRISSPGRLRSWTGDMEVSRRRFFGRVLHRFSSGWYAPFAPAIVVM